MGLIRKYILKDFTLKMLALFLAVFFWFSMTYMGETRMAFLVPLTFYNLDRNSVIRDADTRSVIVTVNGPLSILKRLKPVEDIKVPVNLARVREGRHIFNIGKGDVVVPPGLKVEEAKPDYVVLEMDKLVEKRLRVVVKLDKKWQGAYTVASSEPAYVYVEGPRELLHDRTVLETIPVSGNFTRQTEVLDIPLDGKPVEARRVVPDTTKIILKRTGR